VDPKWLEWARSLQAIAQNGLTYAREPFDLQRYAAVRAIASEIMAHYSDLEPAQVADLFARETGHATPKVDVRGVVFHHNAVLLVREREDRRWSLPGGWADVGESPSAAVVREIREEAGYDARVVKLLALYDRNKHGHPPLPYHVYKLFFRCELLNLDQAPGSDTVEAAFFRENEIPELSTTRVTPAQIARLFDHYRHPEWPTEVD